MTCSNSSFSLVMVTPTSHFFVFHWLLITSICCLFPIGYLPKPTSMGGLICHDSPCSTTSIGPGDILIFALLILSSTGWSCQQHPPIHNTCGTWWHSGNHSESYQCICQQHPLYSLLQVTLIYYISLTFFLLSIASGRSFKLHSVTT